MQKEKAQGCTNCVWHSFEDIVFIWAINGLHSDSQTYTIQAFLSLPYDEYKHWREATEHKQFFQYELLHTAQLTASKIGGGSLKGCLWGKGL